MGHHALIALVGPRTSATYGGLLPLYRMAPILDVSGSWTDGDQYRVLEVLGLGMSQYMVDGITTCMNNIVDALAARVVADLDRYDAAKAAQTAADLTNPENKTLVQAESLKWQVGSGGAGVAREMASASQAVRLAFGSCQYVPQMGYSTTPLIRS